MSEDGSPPPFRRERNLSNRNFVKRGSTRHLSTESQTSSTDSQSTTTSREYILNSQSSAGSATSSSLKISYSVNSDTENGSREKSLRKMVPDLNTSEHTNGGLINNPPTPDPAWLDVKHKVAHFETWQLKNPQQLYGSCAPCLLPVFKKKCCIVSTKSSSASLQHIIDEVRSEDEIDDISDYTAAVNDVEEYILPKAHDNENALLSPTLGIDETSSCTGDVSAHVNEYGIDDFGKVEPGRRRSLSADHLGVDDEDHVKIIGHSNLQREANEAKKGNQDFPRNYRTTPRPKTEVIGTKNRHVTTKHTSYYQEGDDDNEGEEIELRDKCDKFIQPILEELIKTEDTYVENLYMGIRNYGNIFQRKDLPAGLRGKKYVLLGNIEQIAEFHRDEFLPMLQRNRRDLKRLFDEFQIFIEQHCFYGYVIFTMNKQRSLKLCDVFKNYFKLIQSELDDKLGINSFLVQPIQRMARYPLLLQQFITTLFKHRDFVMKPLIESCCRLEKKLRVLLTTTNESEIINDIVDCHEFNVFYQGKFRKVSEFHVTDQTLKRTYRSKLFIFDKCIIYTEIKGKNLVFHGRYPCEHIGIVAKTKSFTLFYERRKQQECLFTADPQLIETWLELIRDMISSYVNEEKQKLQERYSRENDHTLRKPPSLSLFRDSNRFSSDSGIGNIWVLPKPDMDGEAASNRTTWYAVS